MAEVVVIVPLFNHARSVVEVLEGINALGLRPIVVDDGSSDDGADIVARWIALRCPRAALVRLARNGGKAAALVAGFRQARADGATHAVTIDADGQHDSACIPSFLKAAERLGWGNALVLGHRCPIPLAYPLARLAGRTMSGLAIRASCGAVVGDAACGMRLYPIEHTLSLRCLGGRYAWEEEAIIRSVWQGAGIAEVDIPVIYRSHTDAPSHYRFGRDWSEGTAVLVTCVLQRIFDPRTKWRPMEPARANLPGPLSSWALRSARLLWPVERSSTTAGLLSTLMAITGSGVTAVLAAACSATHAPLIVVWAVALVALLAAWRTRCPLLPPAMAWWIGFAAPWAAPVVALVLAPALAITVIRRLRRAPRSSPACDPETVDSTLPR